MSARAPRLRWIDHCRAILTVLVVGHHAAQAYGPTGGAWPVANPMRAPVLGVFIAINAMFFMSLFFFVSGYFTPGTYARKGARAFLIDRAWRLGVPSLLVLLLTGLFMDRPQFLHLWFVVDLLALNLGYVAWQAVRARGMVAQPAREASAPPLSNARRGTVAFSLMTTLVLLSLGTALVRTRYAVDAWVGFLGLLPIEPAHWVHYLAAFVGGILCARDRWLERFDDHVGRALLGTAIVVVAAYALYRLGPARPTPWFAGGGASWSMVRLAVLEAVVGLALGGGALWLCRTWLAGPSPVLSALADDAFGIYCVHLPIVIAVQLAIADLPAGPVPKFVLATSGALALSWLLTRLVLRRGALGRRIF